jgi:glucose/arabinose dehydrogenase
VRFRLACAALILAALPLMLGVSPAGAVAAQESTAAHDLPGGSITLPTGFDIGVYASNVGQARFMAVRPSDGMLFVADANGRILALPDANHDGTADDVIVFASGLDLPSSIAFYQDWLYVGETNEVVRFPTPNNAMQPQGDADVVIPDLPPPTDHWTRTIAFGPDGKLYLAIGSPCNVCDNSDSRRAAISVYDPDGANGRLFATGLRNAVGFTWQPGTNTMWATVNGRDSIGDNIPPDELRIVRDGSFNGWPYCYNGTTPNPEYGDPSLCTSAVPAEVALPAHSAALGITFGDQFNAPQAYKDSIYIAYHGSWNRTVKTGYKVVRVPFVDGKAGQPQDFASGWLPGSADDPGQVWGRPVGVTVGGDGALYVTDDSAGKVYRIAATG